MRYEVYDNSGVMLGSLPEIHNGRDNFHRERYRVLFILEEEQLRYDIANAAFAQGESARVHDNYGHDLLNTDKEAAMHEFKDVCEGGNYDRVRKTVELAISEVEHMLYAYSAHRLRDNFSIDNQQKGWPEKVIELRVPDTFSDTTAWYLLRLINEYIVDRSLEDWASITFPEGAAYWSAKRVEIEEQIRRSSHQCGMPHRVVPSII